MIFWFSSGNVNVFLAASCYDNGASVWRLSDKFDICLLFLVICVYFPVQWSAISFVGHAFSLVLSQHPNRAVENTVTNVIYMDVIIVICRPNHEAVTVRIIGCSPNYQSTILSVICSYCPVIHMFKFLPLLFYLTVFKFFFSVDLLSQRPRFDSRPACVGLLANEVHWGRSFYGSVNPPVLNTRTFIHHRRCLY